jgi:hypothetical protein
MKAVHYALVVAGMPLMAMIGVLVQDLEGFIRNCPGNGYGRDRFLAYCESEYYGDYEHGAYYLQSEPDAVAALRRATVLFFGNSRMQIALSTEATTSFFRGLGLEKAYYLFGFTYTEQFEFPVKTLQKLGGSAKVAIVGVDDRFFEDRMSLPAMFVVDSNFAEHSYKQKRQKQMFHRWICSLPAISGACGRSPSLFRDRQTGAWTTESLRDPKLESFGPDTPDESFGQHRLDLAVAGAEKFVAALRIPRSCIVFVPLPYPKWSPSTAAYLAQRVGVRSVPAQAERWETIDGSHLSQSSAERWSAGVLETVRPAIAECLLAN